MVAQPPPELWRHFGFAGRRRAGAPFVQALAHVPAFLDATGIKFQDLIDLVSTRFVNADDQLQLDTPSPDCDPDTIRIAGLDEARLSRMLRLIRLQRRLGWSFADLDRALVAFGATDLDAAVLEKLAIAQDLADAARSAARPNCWCCGRRIDTWGKDSQFESSSRRAR